ncbi:MULTISPECIES: glycine-rich domain-containing protein [Saccharothrix]|uniref:glycine-rich domain-containing protein n=1 Tax=Saccharothrix TaxID=2071 RepID=UPI00093DD927|nr:hypothetical protein [Saccharothrix sp. CB00851]OKI18162.1 hypothetical protein A6A25_11355 [Saccharothrix sp. CB00851]
MTSSTLTTGPGHGLISPELHGRLVRQLLNEHAGMTGDLAVRTVNQAVVFLKTCADNPGKHFRPSRAVDLGWHQFILNTIDYADFCEDIAGYFIHHVPDEVTPPSNSRSALKAALAPTVQAIRASGFEVDVELWETSAGECTQCHDGCTNCGQGGDDDGAAARRSVAFGQ